MRKEELHALGVTDKETIKQIQILHSNDMQKLKRKILYDDTKETEPLKAAIEKMIAVLETKEGLKRVLSTATNAYRVETRRKKNAEIARVKEKSSLLQNEEQHNDIQTDSQNAEGVTNGAEEE